MNSFNVTSFTAWPEGHCSHEATCFNTGGFFIFPMVRSAWVTLWGRAILRWCCSEGGDIWRAFLLLSFRKSWILGLHQCCVSGWKGLAGLLTQAKGSCLSPCKCLTALWKQNLFEEHLFERCLQKDTFAFLRQCSHHFIVNLPEIMQQKWAKELEMPCLPSASAFVFKFTRYFLLFSWQM